MGKGKLSEGQKRAMQEGRRKNAPPENETPGQTFKRLATSRLKKFAKSAKGLVYLGRYTYNDAQKEAVLAAVEKACESVKTAFSEKGAVEETINVPD